MALVSSLSGPLNPGIALVVSLLLVIYHFLLSFNSSFAENKLVRIKLAILHIPKDLYFYVIPICVFSLYSLYLGRFNSVSLDSEEMPIYILYSRLPEGIFFIITRKLGFPVLLLVIITNVIIIHNNFRTPFGNRLLKLFKWIGIFSLVYIMLLPLGGYRNYRPYILRYDTIIPITVSLMLLFGMTTIFIIKNISRKQKIWYIPLITVVMLLFIYADEPKFDKNICERNAIMQIANSKNRIVEIDDTCTVLSWTIINNPQDSRLNIELLKMWEIIDDEKLFYQRPINDHTKGTAISSFN